MSKSIMGLTSRCLAFSLAFSCIGPTAYSSPFVNKDTFQRQKKEAPVATATVDPAQLVTRVIEVLRSIAEDAKKWEDSALAARAQSQIADLIWEAHNEKALEYLRDAWAKTETVEEPKRVHSTFMNSSLRNTVRREVLLVARKRSPELAVEWLEQMAQESNSAENEKRGTFDDRTGRSAVLLQMANEVVTDNPKAAADLAIESLRDGISFNLQTVLVRIQQKDSVLAETVLRAAIKRLTSGGMNDPNEILTLYAYLYTPGRVYGANTTDNRNRFPMVVGGPRVAVPIGRQNPALALEFLHAAADLLLAAPLPHATNNPQMNARSQLSAIGWLMGELTQRLPEKASLLQARAQQLDYDARFSSVPSGPSSEIPALLPGENKENYAARRVDLLEEAAEKGRDTLTRDIGYAKAASATTVEHYERGLTLTGKIEDKELREGVRSWLIYRAVLHFIASEKFAEAYRLNSKNEDSLQRAACLVVGAQRLVKVKDTIRAAEWLREAATLIKKNEPNERWTRIALGITATYGSFDKQLAVEALRDAVKLMKRSPLTSLVEDRAPGLRRFSGITPPSDFTNATSGFSLQAAVAVFTAAQFEEVFYALDDLTPREARGMALITLCRTYLNLQVKGSRNRS